LKNIDRSQIRYTGVRECITDAGIRSKNWVLIFYNAPPGKPQNNRPTWYVIDNRVDFGQ